MNPDLEAQCVAKSTLLHFQVKTVLYVDWKSF